MQKLDTVFTCNICLNSRTLLSDLENDAILHVGEWHTIDTDEEKIDICPSCWSILVRAVQMAWLEAIVQEIDK